MGGGCAATLEKSIDLSVIDYHNFDSSGIATAAINAHGQEVSSEVGPTVSFKIETRGYSGKIGQAKEFGKVKKPCHRLRALEDMSLMGFHSFELDQIDPSVVGDDVVDLVDEQIVYSLDRV
ncbi:hypothetical protein V6N13_147997 [Hibiscus sabdariffa]|uniref:Uncharacterized protein n=1 Tax=Hibiscus sabdariffa TaxID=183260 RepID=A0ABR2TX84_9ROSI